MLIHLYGFLQDDFLGRVIIADSGQTVRVLADQLQAWGPHLYPSTLEVPAVTNEHGALLDARSTLTDAGLNAGDIFYVRDTTS